MLIDSHCHLDYFTPMELPAVLDRASQAGIREMVTIGTTLAQSQRLPSMIEPYPNLWCTIGVHPHHAAEAPVPTPETLAEMTRHPRVIGIGESGLDYFYDRSPRDIQAENFRAHIRAAALANLPLCIHARDADDDIAMILQQERARAGGSSQGSSPGSSPGSARASAPGSTSQPAFLLHCFSSSRRLAETAIEMGGYISFSGILTFPRSMELRAIAKDIPADRLLVETDAPYLAPVPFRGKRNEPAWVAHTAAVLAEIRGITPAALADLTTTNFRRLFTKTAPSAAASANA
jgi:TatD DNase family protein